MTREKILFVDDEPNILQAFRRHLYNRFGLQTAQSGREALDLIRRNGPFAVIVSDLRMPEMNGIELLARVKTLSPDTVRMMLTGHADVTTAMEAVNEGNIFRFMTKPCNINLLTKSLEAGIEQYRLITAEKDLLEKTLQGAVQTLTEILGLVSHEVMGRSARVKETASALCVQMGIGRDWRVETAALLSQIGCIVLPESLLLKIQNQEGLDPIEERMAKEHPLTAARLIRHIPRMEAVADIIAYQNKEYDGGGYPEDQVKGADLPLGSRILKASLDYEHNVDLLGDPQAALKELKANARAYDPKVLEALEEVVKSGGVVKELVRMDIRLSELKEDMVLDEDLYTLKGQLLVKSGQRITRPLLERLVNFAATHGIKEPFAVIALK